MNWAQWDVDHILQEFYSLFLNRSRTYKIASAPQTKMINKDDIKGLVSSKFLRPWFLPSTQTDARHISSFNPLSYLVPMTNHTCPNCSARVTLFLCPPPHVSYPSSPPPPIFIFLLTIHIPLSPRPPPFHILPLFLVSLLPSLSISLSPLFTILPFTTYSYPSPNPTYISSLSPYPMLSISPNPFFRYSRLLCGGSESTIELGLYDV